MAKPTAETTLVIQDIPQLFLKYQRLIVRGTLLGLGVFLIASCILPSKYKTHFTLTIYAKYFQSPLVGDFIPELSDSGEMRSQRESLIRQALTPEFLDALGEKYGIYSSTPKKTPSLFQDLRSELKTLGVKLGFFQPANPESLQSAERQDLLARIQILDLSNNTFNVGFVYSKPDVVYNAIKEIYNQMIQSLLELRLHSLINVRDAMRYRLESQEAMATSAPEPSVPTRPGAVQEELTDVRNQIAVLSTQYTESHPQMKELREREKILLSEVTSSPQGQTARVSIPAQPTVDGASKREIDSDLMKKLNYLNIAIDSDQQHQADYFATLETPLYPTSPLFPKKSLFALLGLAMGFFGSLFVACILEYFDRSALHTGVLAKQLGVPLLGELPNFPWKTSFPTPMIGAPQQKMTGRD